MAIKYATLHRKNSSSYDAIYPKTHTDQIENLSTLLNAITIDSIGDIDDVVVNSPSEDEGLFYNGDNWVNGTVENILADKTIPGSLTFWHGTSNTAKFKVNIDVLGSPQMEFSDHNNDLYWAFGADDTSTPSNSFKIHGSTSAMPTINGLANPMFEVTQTSGDVRIAGNRIYHVGYKPSWSDLQGSQPAPISHYAHPYIGFSSGTPSTTAGNLIYYDGKLYLGNGSSIGTLYTTTNKPTPADIAAIAKSGISLNNTHDLNNYNTEGERYWWGSSVPTNAPTSYGYMFVSYNNQPQQVVYGGYPAGSEGIWIRRKHSGTWSSWIQMYSPNNKPSASDVGAMSTSHPANAITAQNISDWAQTTDIVGEHNSEWDDAYSWGDHAGLYLGLTAKAADSDKLDGLDSSVFLNNTAVNHSASNLAVGWYTIATNAGDRAIARFGLRDTNSGDHQSVVFYASHHFGRNSDITVWHNSKYSGSPLQKIRIKEGGTYDGAMLQVYIDDATNNVVAYLLGDNFQSNGWVLKDWVPDGTNPGGVNNFAALTNTAAEVDLGLALGGIQSTGDFVSNGQTLVKTNDSRLSDARTPTSHSHLIADLPSDIVVDGDVAATNTASKIVKRDGNGYVFATIFNSTFSGNNTSVAHVMTKNASDDYIRPTAIADFKTSLGSMPASDVSAWAKEASKPSYNYSEISGSVPHDDLPWAGSTTKGGVKLVVSGTTLYIYSS